MEKLSLSDLSTRTDWEEAVIVFTEDSFTEPYTLEQRSYKTNRNWGKYFIPGMLGKSLYGDCLDGKDLGVRLDYYMGSGKGMWHIDYCYIVK